VAGLFVAEDREAHALKASEMPENAKAQALLGELSRLACDQEAWPLPLPAGPAYEALQLESCSGCTPKRHRSSAWNQARLRCEFLRQVRGG
jgi:hypothetical protein